MNHALAIAALALAPLAARAAEVRLLVSIGNNVGDPEDAPLHFADADARRVASLFVDLGGVTPQRAYLVLDQPAAVVREKLAEAAGRIAELAAGGNDVLLMIYVSAHAKAGVLHLMGTHLPLAELRDFAASTQARVRVLVVDACDSGAIARQKGGTPGPEYEVAIERLPLAGQVMISSSGPAESSQEWDSLGGSLFTHHLLTGLRGDADVEGDGKVTLAEVYSYAYRRTILEAVSGAQHPAFDVDLAGTGELVLSEPSTAKSALVFPAALEGRYVLASQPRPDVVAEVDKKKGKALRLAIPPGRYVLRKLLGASVGLMNFELPYGGEQTVDESALVRRNFAEVAVKGGYVELRPSSLLAVTALQSAPIAGGGARFRLGAAYRWTRGELWGMASLLGGWSEFPAARLTTNESAAALGVTAGYRLLWTPVAPFFGLGLELDGLRQTFEREQEADIQRVFGTPLPARNVLGFAASAVAGVEIPLPGTFFVLAWAQGLVRLLPAQDLPDWTLGAQAVVAAGMTF